MGTKNNPGAFDCYDNAEPDEPMFVLLARDPDAPALVRLWAAKRAERVGDDAWDDQQDAKIAEALRCADQMEAWRAQAQQGGEGEGDG